MTVYYRSMRARSLVLFTHITMLAFLLVINRLSSGVTDEIKKTLSIQMMLLTCLNPLFFFFIIDYPRLPLTADTYYIYVYTLMSIASLIILLGIFSYSMRCL